MEHTCGGGAPWHCKACQEQPVSQRYPAELAALRAGAKLAGVDLEPERHTHRMAYHCRCSRCSALRVQHGLPAEAPPEDP